MTSATPLVDELLQLSRFERAMTWLGRRVLRRSCSWVTPRNGRRIEAELDRLRALADRAHQLELETARLRAHTLAMYAERLAWCAAGHIDDDLVEPVLTAVAAVTGDDFLADLTSPDPS